MRNWVAFVETGRTVVQSIYAITTTVSFSYMIYFRQQNNLYLPTDQGDVPLEKRWRRSPYVSHVEQDGEQVLLHMRIGQFYGLDLVGNQIWTILERQRDINGIVQELGAAHNVSPEVLQRDALAFMRTLEKHKLVISG